RMVSSAFPVRIVHARECQSAMMLARILVPTVIFIEATNLLSHNGWVLARLMKLDPELMHVPIVVISDADNAHLLAQESKVYRHLPSQMSVPLTQNIMRECLHRSRKF